MAKDESTSEQRAQEPAPKKKALPLTLAILVGVLVGGGGGAFFVGPVVAEHLGMSSPKAAAAAPAAEADSAAEGEGKEAPAGPTFIHTVDNLVMNPSGTHGTRFLMLTAAFSVGSEEVKKEMEERDPEIRDAVLAVLGDKTVDELTDVARRDSIKTSMRDTVAALFPEGAVKRVYLSQFVIQ